MAIDTHTHFYDPGRPEGVPWPPRDDADLYRAVLPGEWEQNVQPFGVTGTVVVEASPWVEDNQWLLDVARQHVPAPGMQGIVGIVGSLPLGDARFTEFVKRFARHRLFRGIRASGQKTLSQVAAGSFAEDLRVLADHDLALDLNGGDIMAAAVTATRLAPELRIVIDHMGQPGISPEGPTPAWRDAILRAAERPNVFLKVSGLLESAAGGHPGRKAPVEPQFYVPWLDHVWNAFGVDRLMFGSNWPVSDKVGTYGDVVGIVRPYVAAKGAAAEKALYVETSRRAYKWVDGAHRTAP
jgi:L-fuconolactonase